MPWCLEASGSNRLCDKLRDPRLEIYRKITKECWCRRRRGGWALGTVVVGKNPSRTQPMNSDHFQF